MIKTPVVRVSAGGSTFCVAHCAAEQHDLKLIAVDDRFVDASGAPMTNVHYLGISAGKIGNMVGSALSDEMKKRGWPIEETGLCVVRREHRSFSAVL